MIEQPGDFLARPSDAMFKWALAILVASIAAAAWKIHSLGDDLAALGLGGAILLLPGFFALQFMFVRWLLRDKAR